jgi:DNA-binding NarL/FixJ family response regulator
VTRVKNSQVRVMIVEDTAEIRLGIERAITRESHLSLVATCANLTEALACLDRGLVCEVALVDLGLPDGSGIDFISALKRALPFASSVVLTQFDDDERLFSALKHGASGYLLKNASAKDVMKALTDASTGGAPMTPSIARRVLEAFRAPEPTASAALTAHLTERELEVLGELALGHSYFEIAKRLRITLSTVQTFVKRIYGKLNVHSKAEATRLAIRAGVGNGLDGSKR